MKLKAKSVFSRLSAKRNQVLVEELQPITCENCGCEFKGHFCPNCGQEVAEFNRPFGFVLYDFVGNFFAFDTRFFQTFRYLLFRPGFLTVEFFQGRRVRYSPPFRIFVFLSFILFLLLQMLTERGLDQALELNANNLSVQDKSDPDSTLVAGLSVKSDLAEDFSVDSMTMFPLTAKDTVKTNKANLNLDLSIFKSGSIKDNLNKIADQCEAQLGQVTDPAERSKYSSFILMCRAPKMFISNLMKYLSWAFFILLPVFALILKLFYLRRNQKYIKHLLFSVHLHSYLFFILVLITALKFFTSLNLSLIILVLAFSFPVYLVLAIRKFYGQSWGKVLLKFAGISLVYNTVLLMSVSFVLMKSLGFS